MKYIILYKGTGNKFDHFLKDNNNILEIKFLKFYRNNIYSMKNMFNGCQNLNIINFYSFKTDY